MKLITKQRPPQALGGRGPSPDFQGVDSVSKAAVRLSTAWRRVRPSSKLGLAVAGGLMLP